MDNHTRSLAVSAGAKILAPIHRCYELHRQTVLQKQDKSRDEMIKRYLRERPQKDKEYKEKMAVLSSQIEATKQDINRELQALREVFGVEAQTGDSLNEAQVDYSMDKADVDLRIQETREAIKRELRAIRGTI